MPATWMPAVKTALAAVGGLGVLVVLGLLGTLGPQAGRHEAQPECYGVTLKDQGAHACEPTPVPLIEPVCPDGWVDRIYFRICLPS